MEENKYNRDAIINGKETKMSKKILIVGSTGSIGNKLRKTLFEKTDYEITKKGEQFKGHDISRQAIANFVVKLIENSNYGINESFGISRPE